MAMVIFITTNNKSPNFYIYLKTNNYPNGAALADN